MENILVVMDGSDTDEMLLNQALELVEDGETDIHILMSVYDQVEELHKYVGFDNYPEVKQAILDDAEIKLRVLTDKFADRFSSNMAWGKRWHEPVLQEARNIDADLIIKVAGKQSWLSEVLRTPEDWQLLREARCPVWLLNAPRQPIDKVIAAVSTLDESPEHSTLGDRVIVQAEALAASLKVPLQVVAVIPDWNASRAAMAYVPPIPAQTVYLGDIGAQALQESRERLVAILERLDIDAEKAEVRTGTLTLEIIDAVGDQGLLVIGSAAHRGLAGKFIGNSSKKVLHHLKADMLVVH